VSRIGYGYGSEWHLLRSLGYHRAELSLRVAFLIDAGEVDWLDVGCGTAGTDPLAVDLEWLLGEAKANAAEVRSSASATIAPASRHKMEAAFAATAPSFGAEVTDAWFRGGYQFANRLCALDVLNRHEAPARLLLIYFCGDDASRYGGVPEAGGRSHVVCPRDESDWRARSTTSTRAWAGTRGRGPWATACTSCFCRWWAEGVLRLGERQDSASTGLQLVGTS
jgi:hypothetical protein